MPNTIFNFAFFFFLENVLRTIVHIHNLINRLDQYLFLLILQVIIVHIYYSLRLFICVLNILTQTTGLLQQFFFYSKPLVLPITHHPHQGSSSQRVNSEDIIQFVFSSVGCLMGTVGTLLLENPLGQNGLTHQGLLYEAAKVFGLRSRKLKLFLDETQTEGEIIEHANFLSFFLSFLPPSLPYFFHFCFY